MKSQRGIFVAVDGPKYAGKTTLLAEASRQLERMDVSVQLSKEPTAEFKPDQEEARSGLSLAQLLVADRRRHVAEVIEPGRQQHELVVTDRYIASMLVFQVLDGLSTKEVWKLNEGLPLPSLNVFLMADTRSIQRRSRLKGRPTRLERGPKIAAERVLYMSACAEMEQRNVQTIIIDNSDDKRFVDTVATFVNALLKARRA